MISTETSGGCHVLVSWFILFTSYNYILVGTLFGMFLMQVVPNVEKSTRIFLISRTVVSLGALAALALRGLHRSMSRMAPGRLLLQQSSLAAFPDSLHGNLRRLQPFASKTTPCLSRLLRTESTLKSSVGFQQRAVDRAEGKRVFSARGLANSHNGMPRRHGDGANDNWIG